MEPILITATDLFSRRKPLIFQKVPAIVAALEAVIVMH